MDAVTDLPPYTVLENGYIHGTWFCGRPTKPYYGSFPYGFWKRAKHVLRPWGSLLHWFSGLEQPEDGIVTVDGNPEVRLFAIYRKTEPQMEMLREDAP